MLNYLNTTSTFGKQTKDNFINRKFQCRPTYSLIHSFSCSLCLWGESRGPQPEEDSKYFTINSIGVRGGGSEGSRAAAPPVLKNFRANSVFRASASCSKILNEKCISIQWKISGQLCFSGQAQVAQKSWMIKNIFNTVENFTANSVFQGKVKKFSIRYIQPVQAITAKFLVRENTTRKELHPLELTSKVTTEFAYNGHCRRLHQERYCRIEVMSELKCM